jgi:hypothetical protein
LQGLISIGDFKRTDEDYVSIAAVRLSLGRAADALAVLDSVRNPSASSLAVRACALLGAGQAAAALDAWRRRSELAEAGSPRTEEELASTLLQGAVSYPFSGPCFVGVLRKYLELRPDPRGASTVVGVLAELGRVSPEELLVELEQAPETARYSLVRAQLQLKQGNLDEAFAAASLHQPTGGALDFVAASTQLLAQILGPTTPAEDLAALEEWCALKLPSLTKSAPRLADTDDLLLAVSAMGGVDKIAVKLQSSHAEALRYLLTQLVTRYVEIAPDKQLAKVILRASSLEELIDQGL